MKLLLMGFDGLDIKSYQVFGKHLRVPLRSHVPYTGPAWTTICTGLPANVHKVLDPWGRKSQFSASSEEYADVCVWAKLPEDVRVGLWGVPTVYPPKKRSSSFYVAGFPYDEKMKGATTVDLPEGYWKERWWIEEPNIDEDIFTAEVKIRRGCMQLVRLFVNACNEEDVDFGAVGFRFPDRIGHIFGHRRWEYEPAERLTVELVLDIVSCLLEELQPDAWLLVSDHGMYKIDHRDLGVLSASESLEPFIHSRRWWNTRDPAQIVADYFDISLVLPSCEEVEEAEMKYLSDRFKGYHQPIAAEKATAFPHGLRLNLGCGEGQMSGDEWLNVDVVPYPGVELVHDLNNGLPFPDESIAEIRAYDVLEHISYHLAGIILGEWCRVLRPGGAITLRTPDLEAACQDYVAGRLTQLGLVQHLYGRASSLDWDTHFSCFDFEWMQGQLAWWGCTDIMKLPDSSPWALTVCAVKGETHEPKDAAYTLEERQFVQEHLEALGYA